LAKRLGLDYLSTGALLREAVENRTQLGLAAEPILARGGYLPDELMCPILGDWLAGHDRGPGWVLDGFPRTLAQAEYLEKWLVDHGAKIDMAVALEAPYDELISRIRDRVECPECRWSGQRSELSDQGKCPECGGHPKSRADDDEDNFRRRHMQFQENTIPAIDFYRESGKLITVPATGSRDQTTAAILLSLEFKV